jgi:F-type H+-transporting ATPase subunit b
MLDLNLSTILLEMANFFILAYILMRFIIRPLQAVLAKRAQETTRQLDAADAARREAEALRVDYEQKQENLEAEIATRKNEARIVVEQTRQQMLQEVQAQIEALDHQAEEALKRKRAEALQQHRAEIGALAAQMVEQTITDVQTTALQQAYMDCFLEQLRHVNLVTHIDASASDEEIVAEVTSATPLTETDRARLAAILDTAPARTLSLAYQVDPALVVGAVLRLEDVRIDGSLHGQVLQLQKRYQENAQ